MVKNVVLLGLVLGLSANLAYAKAYKGEVNYKSRPLYKGELTVTKPPVFTPCVTYVISPGPYLGINPGVRTNYNTTSSVFKAFEGTVFAGYAMLNSDFYLAAEIFGQHGTELQNYRNNLNANLNPVGLKTSWGAGLSILPGYTLADTILGYLRLGGLVTHFQDAGQSASGGQVGIGVEGSVSQSWDVRAEYTYSFYQSMTGIGAPRSDQFRVGVLYRFWS